MSTGFDSVRSCSPRVTRPPCSCTMPVITLNSVVLPAPLGPMRPITSPGRTVSPAPSSATKPPKRTSISAATKVLVPGWGVSPVGGGRRYVRRRSQLARSRSPSSPPGRSNMTSSMVPPRNRSGNRSMSRRCGSPNCRNSSLPAVISTVPRTAPETERMPPTTSITKIRIPASSVNCFGFTLPSDCARNEPPSAIRPMLTVHAAQRELNKRMPRAGAASSSSRVAIAKRPMRVSWKKCAITSATNALAQSHPLPSSRGMPDRPPAPRVSSFQFLTNCSTTNSAANVIIVGASPLARLTAMPKMPPMITVTRTANSVAPNGP